MMRHVTMKLKFEEMSNLDTEEEENLIKEKGWIKKTSPFNYSNDSSSDEESVSLLALPPCSRENMPVQEMNMPVIIPIEERQESPSVYYSALAANNETSLSQPNSSGRVVCQVTSLQ